MLLALKLFDVFADRAGFLLGIPRRDDANLFAVFALGAQRFAEPAFVVRNEMRGGGKDVAGRTIIAFEADHLRTGKILFKAQDVVHFRTAPSVDRLVVVADAADVFWKRTRCDQI